MTVAEPGSQDGAYGLLKMAAEIEPDLRRYVLVTRGVDTEGLDATPLTVADVTAGTGVIVGDIFDPDQQLAFALPFALERLSAMHRGVAFVGSGCLLTAPLDELRSGLEASAMVVAVPVVPRERDSSTPDLVALTTRTEVVSRRVLGVGAGATGALRLWQRAMHQTVYDVFQRVPGDFAAAVLNEIAGRGEVSIAGDQTVMAWTDYAAVVSGRSDGARAAVVTADQLWLLGRQRWLSKGKEVDVEWQLLADKVHDSRPVERMMEVIEESVRVAPPVNDAVTPFHHLARQIRRASDPSGARFPPGDDAAFTDWLFERNRFGLTRVGHLFWASRADLQERYPDVRFEPSGFREWNDRHGRAQIGMDLFDPSFVPVEPNPAADVAAPIRERVGTALRWRYHLGKQLLPGFGTVQRRIVKHLETRPRKVEAPHRVAVSKEPATWGTSPRDLSLIGCLRSESGLGQAARASLNALRLLQRPFTYIDTTEEYPSRNSVDPGLAAETFGAVGQVNLVHSNADEMITLSNRVFKHRLAGRYNVAMWFWESADLPQRSKPALDIVDELWVASEYLADVFGQYGKVPVKVIGLAAELPEVRQVERTGLGLSDDEFVFLFVYDALSAHGRKNPEKALEAFIRAFAPSFAGVRFVLKVSNLNKFPSSQKVIRSLAEKYPAITVIDEYYTRDAVLDLMAAADAYVSLHAAEGFGLTLLEAMALGTPVIATAYSGSMDFTTSENSWLVDYTMIATDAQTGPYPPGSIWASPNVSSAAEMMREAASDRTMLERKRRAAIRDALEASSLERYAARLDAELRRVL